MGEVGSPKRLKILVLTTIYPNPKQPIFGHFSRERVSRLGSLCDVEVVAPVSLLQQGRWIGRIPPLEIRDGIRVYHPWFAGFPKIFKFLDGLLLFLFLLIPLLRIRRRFRFDLIAVKWAYPDGVAGALAATLFHVPFTVTVLGSDINVKAKDPILKLLICWALRRAGRVVTVSAALRRSLVVLGINPGNLVVVPNGIDPKKFFWMETPEAKRRLNLSQESQVILSIGRLVELKGFDRLIQAVALLRRNPGYRNLQLVILGEGEERKRLEGLIRRLRLEEAVFLRGEIANQEMHLWYNAASIFCLASSNEGYPNVLCEARACGTPVVATSVGGVSEIIDSPHLGLLVERNDPESLEHAILSTLTFPWDRVWISRQGQRMTWDHAAAALYELMADLSRETHPHEEIEKVHYGEEIKPTYNWAFRLESRISDLFCGSRKAGPAKKSREEL